MVTIQGDCTYKEEIIRYFSKEVPFIAPPNESNLLEIITDLLIGTKETRYGSIPKPEHLVVIREVIRESIEKFRPIPILIPYGGIKGNLSSEVDVAEFTNINRIAALDALVRKYFSPGLVINLRIEDAGAMYLYRGMTTNNVVMEYTDKLARLVHILTPKTRIATIPESSLMGVEQYAVRSDKWAHILFEYLMETQKSPELLGRGLNYKNMTDMGWQGVIPVEQREHYLNRYRALYPGQSEDSYVIMLAQYLAGSKVRYEMHGTAAPEEKYIQISFVQPIPGAPVKMFNNTLYHRTLSLSEARTHMPAWRSKGYLKIEANGGVKTKITNFGDKELMDQLFRSEVVISNGESSVNIRADYMIAD